MVVSSACSPETLMISPIECHMVVGRFVPMCHMAWCQAVADGPCNFSSNVHLKNKFCILYIILLTQQPYHFIGMIAEDEAKGKGVG